MKCPCGCNHEVSPVRFDVQNSLDYKWLEITIQCPYSGEEYYAPINPESFIFTGKD